MCAFFLPYQQAWLRDTSRIKLMEKSRQIGMSWTAAYELVRRHALSECPLDSWVSSRDEMQAKLFIDDCKKFASVLNVAAEDISGGKILAAADSQTLGFANGTRIWSLSSNPDAQAGKRGTRVLDEFALHPDPVRLYSVAYPGITWGGSLEIISTHRGRENFFYKLVEEARYGGNPKNISVHRVTLQDALEQGFLKKLKENLPAEHEVASMDEGEYFDYVKNSCADTESFLQEYMCEPADDNAGFVSYDTIQKCVYKCGEDWRQPANPENPLYLGVDVGRSRDLTVFWLLERCADVLYTRDVKVLRDIPFSEQELVLYSYLSLPALRRAAIDQSGLGRQFAERAQERYSSSRIEGVSFTSSTKEMLAYPLRSRFEDATIRIPDDMEIRADIRAVRKETTASGGIRFCAERTADGHADRFWALALAVHAASSGSSYSRMELVGRKENGFIW